MSTAAMTDGPMTAEQLFRLPRDERSGVELIRGRLHRVVAAGYRHMLVSAHVCAELWNFVQPRRLGHVLAADTGFVLERAPDTVRAPDGAFVSRARIPGPDVVGYAELAPDLVVEVVSPNDRRAQVMAKARFWVDKGSRLVWVIDPGPRIAVVLGPGSTRRLEEGDGVLGGEDVLPGFRLALADLFADLPPS